MANREQMVDKFKRDGNTTLYYLPPEKLYSSQETIVRIGHGKQTGLKLGKEYIKAVYCYLPHLTSMQSTPCETPGWMKHKLESKLPEEISVTSDMQMIRL